MADRPAFRVPQPGMPLMIYDGMRGYVRAGHIERVRWQYLGADEDGSALVTAVVRGRGRMPCVIYQDQIAAAAGWQWETL